MFSMLVVQIIGNHRNLWNVQKLQIFKSFLLFSDRFKNLVVTMTLLSFFRFISRVYWKTLKALLLLLLFLFCSPNRKIVRFILNNNKNFFSFFLLGCKNIIVRAWWINLGFREEIMKIRQTTFDWYWNANFGQLVLFFIFFFFTYENLFSLCLAFK
jgi:hypothetical protein